MMGADDSTWGNAAERWEELRKFRATHQPKHITVRGVNWDYIVSGEGGEALLLLPGGAMVGESLFTRIPAFEDRYRVIAPDYPYVSTAALLLDGLAGVLDAEGVRVAHVLGAFLRRARGAVLRATPSRAGAIADTDEHRRAAEMVPVAGEYISDAIAFRPARMAAGA